MTSCCYSWWRGIMCKQPVDQLDLTAGSHRKDLMLQCSSNRWSETKTNLDLRLKHWRWLKQWAACSVLVGGPVWPLKCTSVENNGLAFESPRWQGRTQGYTHTESDLWHPNTLSQCGDIMQFCTITWSNTHTGRGLSGPVVVAPTVCRLIGWRNSQSHGRVDQNNWS